jgi:hypothetical protein
MLAEQVKESCERLTKIQALIPESLRSSVKAGPIVADSWCLLVTSNAAAAKLRQISPLMLLRLNREGLKVNSIRLKVLIARKR